MTLDICKPPVHPAAADIPMLDEPSTVRSLPVELQPHPAAEIFPAMTDEEFAKLKADIAANGQQLPIRLHEGKILDGRHRYRACRELGIEPRFTQYTGGDPLGFVVSLNWHRRNLDESQRALVAGRIANMRQGERTDLEPSANLQKVSVSQAAELLKVSERSVYSARKVIDHGAPELVQAVESGTVSVSAAAAVTELPKSEQRAIAARGKKGIRQAAKEIGAKRAKKRRTSWVMNELKRREQERREERTADARRCIRPKHVTEETINTLSGIAVSLRAIEGGDPDVDQHAASEHHEAPANAALEMPGSGITIDEAISALKRTFSPSFSPLLYRVRNGRAQVTMLRNKLLEAEKKLAEAEKAAIAAALELTQEAAHMSAATLR